MIEQTATVLRVDSENVLIEVNRQASCSSCSAKTACGKSLLDNVFKVKPLQVSILNTVGAKENDNVIVGLNETVFVQASFYLYILPLLSMLFFAMGIGALQSDNTSEPVIVIAGVVGLFFGAAFSRVILNRKQSKQKKLFEPVLIKVVSENNIAVNLVENI